MRAAALSAIVLLCACGPSLRSDAAASNVSLSVAPDAVAAGDPVTLVLDNGSTGAIGYNLCTSALERRSDGGWEPLPPERVCTMELRRLEPGEEVGYPMELPEGLDPGEYRFVTNIETLETGEREGLRSDPFRVMP